MENDIIRKLRAELERGISTESQVVYLMVKTRKLLDLERARSIEAYDTLRLYCDWCLHVELCGPQAQKIVITMDELYPSVPNLTLSEEGKNYLRDTFSFNRFREELNCFFANHNLPTFSEPEWNTFLSNFMNTVEECSLKCNPKRIKLANVDEVVLLKVDRSPEKIAEKSLPPILWALCLGGKLIFPLSANTELSDEVVNALIEFGKRREQTVLAN